MVVPTAWWHATCSTANTVSIGGQDMCGLEHDCLAASEASGPMEWRLCDDPLLAVACHGPHGVETGRKLPPRLLQPLWRLGFELPFDIIPDARGPKTDEETGPASDGSVLGIGRLVARPPRTMDEL